MLLGVFLKVFSCYTKSVETQTLSVMAYARHMKMQSKTHRGLFSYANDWHIICWCQLINILAMPPPGGQVGNFAHLGKKYKRTIPISTELLLFLLCISGSFAKKMISQRGRFLLLNQSVRPPTASWNTHSPACSRCLEETDISLWGNCQNQSERGNILRQLDWPMPRRCSSSQHQQGRNPSRTAVSLLNHGLQDNHLAEILVIWQSTHWTANKTLSIRIKHNPGWIILILRPSRLGLRSSVQTD